jgi:hypothetical protein
MSSRIVEDNVVDVDTEDNEDTGGTEWHSRPSS